jgi:PAS domain S-box-containing protein
MQTLTHLGDAPARLFFDRHPHAALLMDGGGRVLHANPAADWLASNGDYPDFAALTGLSWADGGALPHDLSDGWTRRLRVRAADGSTRQVDASLFRAGDGADDLAMFFLVLRDVTVAVEAARGGHELESRSKATTDSAPVLIWMASETAARDWFNKSWLRFRGRTLGDELGDGWTEGVHPEDLERCLGVFSASFDEREPFSMDYRLRRHDGVHRWMLETAIPRWSADGDFLGYIGTCLDITDRRELEDKLADHTRLLRLSDKRREDFLARLSHELRNPLGAVANAAAILRTLEHGDANLVLVREIVERQVGHLGRLVSDLVDVTRITKGKIVLQRDRLDVDALIATAVADVRDTSERRSQRVAIEPLRSGVRCDGDAHRLRQALSALLDNASKFSPDGATITVSVTVAADVLAIRVKDTGAGIAPELLPHAFEIFAQGAQTNFGTGLGVGLTIAQHVARLHGGELQLDSAGQGLGTEATLTLPLPHASDAAATNLGAITGRRVLIIEDNADARESLRMLVETQGNEVVTAADAAQALAIAARFVPEVVICDIGLPDSDGFKLVRRLRETLAAHDTRYVALTGYGRTEDLDQALNSGFDSFLVKPLRPAAAGTALADASA